MAGGWRSKSKLLPATFAWSLLLTLTALFFVYPCWQLTAKYHLWVIGVQAPITFFVVANFFLATFMDPGSIPKASPDEDADDDFRAPLYKNVEINGITVRMKWCVTCQFYRPPRCSHCSVCNTCIETFDHHCPWVNNCIGRRNYRHFFFFLIFLSIHMVTIMSWCVIYVLDQKENLDQVSPIITLVIMGIIAILLIPILGLTGFHVVLVARGRTTNEQVTGKFQGGYNPFSRGCFTNCCFILCGPKYPRYSCQKKKKRHPTQFQHHYNSLRASNQGDNTVKVYMDDNKTLLNSPKPRTSSNGSKKSTSNSNSSPNKRQSSFTQNSKSSSAYRNDGSAIALERLDTTTQSQSRDCEPSPPTSPRKASLGSITGTPTSPPLRGTTGSLREATASNMSYQSLPGNEHFKASPQRYNNVHHNNVHHPTTMRKTENGKTETTFLPLNSTANSPPVQGPNPLYYTNSSSSPMNYTYSYGHNSGSPSLHQQPVPHHHQHYHSIDHQNLYHQYHQQYPQHQNRPHSPAKSTSISEISTQTYGPQNQKQTPRQVHEQMIGGGPGGMVIFYSPDGGQPRAAPAADSISSSKFYSEGELQKMKHLDAGHSSGSLGSNGSQHVSDSLTEKGHHFAKRPMSFMKALEISDKLDGSKQVTTGPGPGPVLGPSISQQQQQVIVTNNPKYGNSSETNSRISAYEMNYEISV